MIAACGVNAQQLPGYETVETVKHRMKTESLMPVEGIWKFPQNGTLIIIERDDMQASRFRIVALESDYIVIESGQLLGYAYPTTKPETFEASLTEINGDGSSKKEKAKEAKFLITFAAPDAITFKPLKKGWTVNWNWWRLFPYMFRFNIDKVDNKPKDIEGAVKVWPKSSTYPPRQPRYL